MDSYGEIKMIYTDETTELLCVKSIEKHQYFKTIEEKTEKYLNQLKCYPIKYKKYYDFQENHYAPFIVTKCANDDEL